MSEQDSQTTPESAAPAAPAPARRGGAGTVFFSLTLSILASAAVVVAAPYWTPTLTKMVKLRDPVRQLEVQTAQALTESNARVAALTEKVGALAGTVEGSTGVTGDLRSATLVLAVGELRNALRRNGPFEVELATVRGIAGKDAEVEKVLAAIEPFSAAGIPSRAQLRADFPRAAAAAVSAAPGKAPAAAKEAGAWYAPVASAWTQIRYFVRLEAPPSDSAYAVAQRARAKLGDDDLAGAVEELLTLPGQQDPATSDWVSQAQARVAADTGAAALTTLALSRVSK